MTTSKSSIPIARPARLGRLGDLLTREYCPRWDRYARRLRNPLAVLVLATAASTLCGLYLHAQGFVLAFALATVLVVGTAWPWLAVRGLAGSLSFDTTRTREGKSVGVGLSVRNRCPWGVWGISVRAGLGPDQDAALPHAAGWSTTVAAWDFVPDCRGEYPAEPPRIASGFPFGLWRAARELTVAQRLIVWPRTFPVGPIPESPVGRSFEGLTTRDRPGHSGDVLGVRPWRRGDPLRRIHWPQTARHGQLIVCESQANAVPWIQVVLDVHPGSHAGSGGTGSREWAIRVAASFLEGWIGDGAEVDTVFSGRVVAPRERSIPARRARILDALARIGPDDSPALGDLLDLPACRDFGGGLRLVVTTDRALERLAPRRMPAVPERFVVLRAAAFEPGRAPVAPLPLRPWILLDDPARVPHRLQHAGKEVARG